MQQFKPYFMGLAEPPSGALTSVQKCFRTSDIDKVGLTARHCTFFEMLGNFSVGDYFKEGAIRFAWEFSLDYLELDPDRIWVSYFEGDDEIARRRRGRRALGGAGRPPGAHGRPAAQRQLLGPGRAHRALRPLLRALLRPGPEYGCADPDCKPGLRLRPLRRVLEPGLHRLQHGRERAAHPPAHAEHRHRHGPRAGRRPQAGRRLGLPHRRSSSPWSSWARRSPASASARTSRSTSPCGCWPTTPAPCRSSSPTACCPATRAGATCCAASSAAPPASAVRPAWSRRSCSASPERTIELMGGAYPELVERRETILRTVGSEEERFNRTLDQGLVLVEEAIAEAPRTRAARCSPARWPSCCTTPTASRWRSPGRSSRSGAWPSTWRASSRPWRTSASAPARPRRAATRSRTPSSASPAQTDHATEFKGYEREDLYTVVENVETLDDGRVLLALRESPFYAEMGGQTADTGRRSKPSPARPQVVDVQQQGEVQVHRRPAARRARSKPGTRVKAALSSSYRHDVAANHTATHLLHYALRARVWARTSPRRARRCGRTSSASTSPITSPRARAPRGDRGAGQPPHRGEPSGAHLHHQPRARPRPGGHGPVRREVRRLRAGGRDRRLQPRAVRRHPRGLRPARSGLFKILSEGSVGANVRRIEAVSGRAAVAYYRERDLLVSAAASALGVTEDQLLPGLAQAAEPRGRAGGRAGGLRVAGRQGRRRDAGRPRPCKHDGVAVVAADGGSARHGPSALPRRPGARPHPAGRGGPGRRAAGQGRAGGQRQRTGSAGSTPARWSRPPRESSAAAGAARLNSAGAGAATLPSSTRPSAARAKRCLPA